MEVIISLPEDISESLQGCWGNVSRHALEVIAVEGYRTGALTKTQVQRLLGLETRFEVHGMLKECCPFTTRKPTRKKISPLIGASTSSLRALRYFLAARAAISRARSA